MIYPIDTYMYIYIKNTRAPPLCLHTLSTARTSTFSATTTTSSSSPTTTPLSKRKKKPNEQLDLFAGEFKFLR